MLPVISVGKRRVVLAVALGLCVAGAAVFCWKTGVIGPRQGPVATKPTGPLEGANLPVSCPVSRPDPLPMGMNILLEDDHATDVLAMQIAHLDGMKRPEGAEEWTALRWLLFQPDRSPVLRNELANRLDEWNPDWYLDDLKAAAANPAQPVIWRNYAVQHMGQLYDRHGSTAALDAIKAMAASTEPMVRGQAIFCQAEFAKGRNWFATQAADYAEFRTALAGALVAEQPILVESAIRAAAVAELREVCPLIEGIAADRTRPMQVRVAAVQCLGKIGRQESRAVLAACAEEPNPRLSGFAATSMGLLEAH